MTTGATGQLGLALPVQGELAGTWGDTVNNGITQYTNIAIAATLTLTGDGAVTLANTTGDASASNITSTLAGAGTVTAQFAIVRISGTLTTTKVITAPSYSKTYVVVNAATGGAVTFKASGQTGISVAVGESAYTYYNGTDYVKLTSTSSGAAGGSTTQVQYNSSGTLAGSANLTFDGTTLSAAAIADASLTSGRVTYAGASGNLTDSANLTFNGTTLVANDFTDSSLTSGRVTYAGASGNLTDSANLTFNGTSLTANTLTPTNALGVAYGGTGQTSYTNGQLLIGNTTGNTLAKATLTAGTGITVTNGSGTITIASSGGGGSSTGSTLYLAVNFGGF